MSKKPFLYIFNIILAFTVIILHMFHHCKSHIYGWGYFCTIIYDCVFLVHKQNTVTKFSFNSLTIACNYTWKNAALSKFVVGIRTWVCYNKSSVQAESFLVFYKKSTKPEKILLSFTIKACQICVTIHIFPWILYI